MHSNFYGLVGAASNIKRGPNPPFALTDLYDVYPQFGPDGNGNYVVPVIVMQMYLDLANVSILVSRWHSYWRAAMCWFIAHFCTLYLQSVADPNGGAAGAIAAGQAKGLNTSESVGDVSVSMDYNTIAQDLDGWAAWKLTIYGQQLATIGKLVGKGGMYVY
ncbi:DUF4054 domain-containing protein [Paenibacillus sp. GCM10012303]|uniref:DUF4054 domain-containing protein n=1 Tax=Paenibacillus sp. GCM10012303 TaxID=3317340 RepID=UPI00360815DC